MDQAQEKALQALEPFISLAQAASSPRGAAQVITQATSASNTYVFAELLRSPNIEKLQSSVEYLPYLTLLRIFSWGVWEDYQETSGLPKLSEPQALKLRQLTLVSLSVTPHLLTYHHLQKTLSLPSTRALEDLVISAIYSGLIVAKLDTLAQRVEVSSVAALRDLKPGALPHMIDILDDWDHRCSQILSQLDTRVTEVRKRALKERRREEANDRAVQQLLDEKEKDKERDKDKDVDAPKSDGSKPGKPVGGKNAFDDADEMEIADDAATANVSSRTKHAKRGGGGFGKR